MEARTETKADVTLDDLMTPRTTATEPCGADVMACAVAAMSGLPLAQDRFDAELRRRGIEVPARKRRGALDRKGE
jgi:hypothetical protein